jgi:hypothetical protein
MSGCVAPGIRIAEQTEQINAIVHEQILLAHTWREPDGRPPGSVLAAIPDQTGSKR